MKIPVRDKKTKKIKPLTIRCDKQYCRRCGGLNGFLHKRRMKSITEKLGDISGSFIRQFVFTLPHSVTDKFMSSEMLNNLVGVVKQVIEKGFGEVAREKRTKKGIKRRYALHKKVLVTVEPFGEKGADYHPHVNVLMIEGNTARNLKTLPLEKLNRIKKAYKEGVERLVGEKITSVVVHYSYRDEEK